MTVAHTYCAVSSSAVVLSRAVFGLSNSTAVLNIITAVLESHACLVQTIARDFL